MNVSIRNCLCLQASARVQNNIANKRILHVSAVAEVIVHFKLPLLAALDDKGARQTIYCSDEQYCRSREDAYKEGGHIKMLLDHDYRVQVGNIRRRPSLRTILDIIALFKYLRQERFDIVMAHQPQAALVAIPASIMANTPLKVYFSGGLMILTAVERLFKRHVENLLIRYSDATMLNNMEDFEYASKIAGPKSKAYFVSASEGCGVDTSEFNVNKRLFMRDDIRNELCIEDGVQVVGFIGRCVWKKGIRELIDAASIIVERHQIERIMFLIVGTGSDYDAVISEVERRKLSEHFIFTGYRSDVERYFSAIDVFVHPSYWEGLPTSLLQAMAMGLPCLATDIRGSRELIQDGLSGIILKSHEPEELAAELIALLEDGQMALSLGNNANLRITNEYSQSLLLPRTIDIINSVMDNSLATQDSMDKRKM